MLDPAQITPELQQFLDLVESTAMTGPAFAAYELASAALENAALLDEDALRGFVIFLSIAKVDPDKAAELLEDE